MEKTQITFETPFSLDEMQVRFVTNEATFYDPAEAKKALEPVVKQILGE